MRDLLNKTNNQFLIVSHTQAGILSPWMKLDSYIFMLEYTVFHYTFNGVQWNTLFYEGDEFNFEVFYNISCKLTDHLYNSNIFIIRFELLTLKDKK